VSAYVVTAPLVQALVDAETGVYTHVYQGGTLPADVDKGQLEMLLSDGLVKAASADEADAESKPLTIDEILSDVGNDKDKAQAALDAENGTDKPRKTLVDKLTAIAAG
jgi:hypothetical protein